MILKNVFINKFRGFSDVNLPLGENITVIAGQNGTQKTTILGLITQPFSITDKDNPIIAEIPLCGGNYRSAFAEKFKLSDKFDKPHTHEWTLTLCDPDEKCYTVESILRDKESNTIRFWKKGDRTKGSGYLQFPTIYLSLSRLFPIGEDKTIDLSTEVKLTEDEFKFYQKWHDKILIVPNDKMENIDYLKSKQKNTLGVSTSYYDWKMNSAGQDNIGKILLAVLSFKRLKEKYKNIYKGGVLAIDELDSTLYPASQLKLLEALRSFSSKYKIQIVFTTHSLCILEKAAELQNFSSIKGQIVVNYLEKRDNNISILDNISFERIKNKLNVQLKKRVNKVKIRTFVEDKEAEIFAKGLLKQKASVLNIEDCNLGCDSYLELVRKKIEGFKLGQSIIILDGDVDLEKKKINASARENILLLPSDNSPERLIAKMLNDFPERSNVWDKIYEDYTKQIAFRDYSYEEIMSDREKAKKWFNEQKEYWGRGARRIINMWIEQNKDEVESFKRDFDKLLSKYAI